MTEEVTEVCETPAVSRTGTLARDTAGVHKTRTAPRRPPHVVIVGAGFAGLAAAKLLAKAPVDVTVIDRRNHQLFQPLLYQVATAALSPAEIATPIRAVLGRTATFRCISTSSSESPRTRVG
jgi:NADPH-dependent 2,4-dienoyl-CoA reductase/sulfur reductase-like enzyme